MNLSAVSIGISLLQRPAKRHRKVAGTYTDGGKYLDAADVVSDIKAVIQPFADTSKAQTNLDLRALPGGDEVEDFVIVWTRDDIRCLDETAGTPADIIEAPDGRRFKVLSLSIRPEGGFNRAIAGLINDRGRSL